MTHIVIISVRTYIIDNNKLFYTRNITNSDGDDVFRHVNTFLPGTRFSPQTQLEMRSLLLSTFV